MTTTYTLVLATAPQGVTLLIGSPRDGDQAAIDAAIAEHCEMERRHREAILDREAASETLDSDIDLVRGCVLTDEEPDTGDVVWRGNYGGWLIDENGRTWEYAVRGAAA